jgi:hypothetical protein
MTKKRLKPTKNDKLDTTRKIEYDLKVTQHFRNFRSAKMKEQAREAGNKKWVFLVEHFDQWLSTAFPRSKRTLT